MKKFLIAGLVIAAIAISATAGAANNFLTAGSTPDVSVSSANNFLTAGSTPPGPVIVVPDNNGPGPVRDRNTVSKSGARLVSGDTSSGMTFLEWMLLYGPIVPETPVTPEVKPPVKKPIYKKPAVKPVDVCECIDMGGDIQFFVGEKIFAVTTTMSKGKEIVEFEMIDCGLMNQAVTNIVENAYAEISVRGDHVTVVVKNATNNREVWKLTVAK
ncbi:hypothetical protein CVV38_02175 [Candidatus Peregrinibacteria bacterium HGW-Peregrinibacteria-1]|jgi:hypothetical protein|nr:MAG: hypothetical protein CVV38_02175 [Candidatus Peregrinibacteria bacterium HGW-Peregrinibacteria-1]